MKWYDGTELKKPYSRYIGKRVVFKDMYYRHKLKDQEGIITHISTSSQVLSWESVTGDILEACYPSRFILLDAGIKRNLPEWW